MDSGKTESAGAQTSVPTDVISDDDAPHADAYQEDGLQASQA